MNNVLFRRGDQTFIDENVPLNDGQIIFNETDEAIYVDTTIDNVVTRKRYGGGNLSRSDIDMALSTVSENPVANKVLTELMLQKADVIDDLGTAVAVTENGVPVGCKTVQGLNTKINTTQAQVSNSGDAYDPTKPYKVGDLCIYNNVLYRCITACSAGSWATNQSCFTADTLINVTNDLNSGLNSTATLTQKNSAYVGLNLVYVLRIGNLVNVSGRFEVVTQKPTGQANYLFSNLPVPKGGIIPVSSDNNTVFLIVNNNGQLTSNSSIPTGYYNIDVTYSAI